MERILRQYAIGGFVIEIQGPVFEESEYLSPFRCQDSSADVQFQVTSGEAALPRDAVCRRRELHSGIYEAEGQEYRVLFQEKSEAPLLVILEERPRCYKVTLEERCLSLWDSNLVMKMLDLPMLLLRENGVFLHASFVEYRGRAILFTAPKQTGKSTQAALWQRHRNACIINGDRALLRCRDGVWMAYGSPYCGTSQICRAGQYPLAVVVLLSQGKENALRPARAREAAAAFLDGCTFDPKKQTEQVLDLALDLWQHIPVFCLSCLPDASAVSCLEEAILSENQ
ncbi:MAG: hypothetical protein IJA48_04045 [Oscillospiraceae bacterium]|nr:hypothetical protein [Oscillospiraceae bacterium]